MTELKTTNEMFLLLSSFHLRLFYVYIFVLVNRVELSSRWQLDFIFQTNNQAAQHHGVELEIYSNFHCRSYTPFTRSTDEIHKIYSNIHPRESRRLGVRSLHSRYDNVIQQRTRVELSSAASEKRWGNENERKPQKIHK